jgi:hypothetical protein
MKLAILEKIRKSIEYEYDRHIEMDRKGENISISH